MTAPGVVAVKPIAFAVMLVAGLLAAGVPALLLVSVPSAHAQAETLLQPWVEGEGITIAAVVCDVVIRDGLARTRLVLDLSNAGEAAGEARVELRLPAYSALLGFRLTVDGEVWEGQVHEDDKARSLYNASRDAGDDAVLLEVADDFRFALRLSVPGNASRTLEMVYMQHVGLDAGGRVYRLDTGALAGAGSIASFNATIDVASSAGIGAASTPALPLVAAARADGGRTFTHVAKNTTIGDDVVVVWTEGQGSWLPTLVMEAPTAGDDLWSGLVTVGFRGEETGSAAPPRDVVFVLDTSGSMGGVKIEQAVASLQEILLTLRPDDRFAVVGFSSTVVVLTDGLVTATSTNVASARSALDVLYAGGGTDFDGGLQRALALLGDGAPGRVPLVVLVSDGQPTEGVTAPNEILARLGANNDADAAVHLVAIGIDADGTFMEDVAASTAGSLTVIAPDEDIESRLATFYATLMDPYLVDVTIEVEGLDVLDARRLPPPDLYPDGTVRMLFHLASWPERNVTIVLRGNGADGPAEHRFPVLHQSVSRMAGIATLWGAAHVDSLIRAGSETLTPGERDAVVENATRYGVATPYTSWVIVRPSNNTDGENTTSWPAPRPSYPPAGTFAMRGNSYDPNALQRSVATTMPYATPTGPAAGPTKVGVGHNASADDAAEIAETPAPSVALPLAVTLAVAAFLAHRRRKP